jgi:hypothetical protein
MTMTSPMTSIETAMTLDTHVPVRITAKSDFFDDIAEHWTGEAMTVFDLLRRETTERVRYAYRSGVNAIMETMPTGLKSVAQPYFEPRAQPKFTPTAELQLLEERTVTYTAHETDVLVAIWNSEGELPVADLTRPQRGFKYRMRRAFWFFVDGPKDLYEAVNRAWNAVP